MLQIIENEDDSHDACDEFKSFAASSFWVVQIIFHINIFMLNIIQ